ncbi:unnamed protein product [Adineta steineri]|uniref:Transmembrane protein n=1 Tax=Adineta steineri TaxID=433720 RepID=A0A818VXZ0_9BILA|nr:unnamed protein product [Adineta steineri]
MTIKYCYLFLFLIKFTNSEIFPFFIHADQIFIKCSNGNIELFNSTTDSLPACIQTTHIERFNLFQLYIQCPNEHLHLEYNRSVTLNAQTLKSSISSFQPHCFTDYRDEYMKQNQLSPYRTRYTSNNDTLTQIISFQCQYSIHSKSNEEFYLFFKLMNYGLCRYSIQFMYLNGKCNRFYQQIYKIQARIEHSICYYQLGLNPSEISLEFFDQLIYTNMSSNKQLFYSTKSVNHTNIIIITISITTISLILCLAISIVIYRYALFRSSTI